MGVYEFAAEVLRPANIVLGLVSSVWFTLYISHGWSRLPAHFRRLALVMMLLLFSALFSTAESYVLDVKGGLRVYSIALAFLGTIGILVTAHRRGHKAGDTVRGS